MAEFFLGLQPGEGDVPRPRLWHCRLLRRRPLRTGPAAIMAGTALLTAACSGGSSSPQAASLGMTGLAGGPGGNG